MTSPTAAQITCAVKVADATGKVAFVMRDGIALVDPKELPLPSPETGRPNSCDLIFGTG